MAYKKNILTIDFDEATAATGRYTFDYNLYNSIAFVYSVPCREE